MHMHMSALIWHMHMHLSALIWHMHMHSHMHTMHVHGPHARKCVAWDKVECSRSHDAKKKTFPHTFPHPPYAGFTRMVNEGDWVAPVALRVQTPWNIRTHTLLSSFPANLFWMSFCPWVSGVAHAEVVQPRDEKQGSLVVRS